MSYQQDIFHVVSSIIGQNNIVPIQIEMVRFVGDYHTTALLTQLIYWQGKQKDPDGWIYKTYDEWERELALTKYQASRSAKTLEKMGIIETKVKKINLGNGMFGNTAVHYKLNRDFFIDSFCKYLKSVRSKETSLPENKELHFQESSNLTSLPINTETTSKDYDNIQVPAPPDPKPMQKQEKKSSSSFSESQLITILAELMALIPEQHQKPSVKATITKALNAHSEDYVRLAILYTIAYSNGETWQKFKSYLGKCIENHWHDGWEPDIEKVVNESIRQGFMAMPDKALKQLSDAGNIVAIEEMKRREKIKN